MNVADDLIRQVGRYGGQIATVRGNLELSAPNPLPGDLMGQLQRQKQAIVIALIAAREGGVPVEWIDGVGRLKATVPPADMPSRYWQSIIANGIIFLDQWAAQASALGWTTLDVFGVHRHKPYGGIHCSGLVPLINGNLLTAITADAAVIRHNNGAHTTYYRRAVGRDQVAVWELDA